MSLEEAWEVLGGFTLIDGRPEEPTQLDDHDDMMRLCMYVCICTWKKASASPVSLVKPVLEKQAQMMKEKQRTE